MAALPVSSHATSPWHAGENRLQRQAGSFESLAEIGPRIIRSALPQQHRDFFAQLPFVVTGAADADGQPWAGILSGRPGFIRSPADDRLDVAALPPAGDPLHGVLAGGHPLALLGIELHTRRRNRANGRVVAAGPAGLQLQVLQSFGNCPKYIQPRELAAVDRQPGPAVRHGPVLDPAAAAVVAGAGTFFIASQALAAQANGGADVSHRGGEAGFVSVLDGGRSLVWDDFAGNRFFNTLGNIVLEPRVGLLFIDFDSGTLLQLAGRASIAHSGDQRQLRFELTQWLWRPAAWPFVTV